MDKGMAAGGCRHLFCALPKIENSLNKASGYTRIICRVKFCLIRADMSASIVLALGICFLILFVAQSQKTDNIDGTYAVKKNHHYSNKTSVTWGQNGLPDFQVMISLAPAAATYDCQNTSTYSCEDSSYMYDWNKLWGKARCGYTHDHHEDSDRFVFRKCSDSSCAAYTGTAAIQLAAYSYDNGVPPYTGENPGLLKEFHTLIFPDTQYILQLIMDSTGLSTFNLRDKYGSLLESQYVQHSQLCEDNFYEGTVQGLYFGGTCAAPEEIVCTYWS